MADICPTCGDLCPPDATRCDCGERLQPSAPIEVSTDVETLHGPDCPCMACYFAGLDGDIRNV